MGNCVQSTPKVISPSVINRLKNKSDSNTPSSLLHNSSLSVSVSQDIYIRRCSLSKVGNSASKVKKIRKGSQQTIFPDIRDPKTQLKTSPTNKCGSEVSIAKFPSLPSNKVKTEIPSGSISHPKNCKITVSMETMRVSSYSNVFKKYGSIENYGRIKEEKSTFKLNKKRVYKKIKSEQYPGTPNYSRFSQSSQLKIQRKPAPRSTQNSPAKASKSRKMDKIEDLIPKPLAKSSNNYVKTTTTRTNTTTTSLINAKNSKNHPIKKQNYVIQEGSHCPPKDCNANLPHISLSISQSQSNKSSSSSSQIFHTSPKNRFILSPSICSPCSPLNMRKRKYFTTSDQTAYRVFPLEESMTHLKNRKPIFRRKKKLKIFKTPRFQLEIGDSEAKKQLEILG